jgi:hypothetical protein
MEVSGLKTVNFEIALGIYHPRKLASLTWNLVDRTLLILRLDLVSTSTEASTSDMELGGLKTVNFELTLGKHPLEKLA